MTAKAYIFHMPASATYLMGPWTPLTAPGVRQPDGGITLGHLLPKDDPRRGEGAEAVPTAVAFPSRGMALDLIERHRALAADILGVRIGDERLYAVLSGPSVHKLVFDGRRLLVPDRIAEVDWSDIRPDVLGYLRRRSPLMQELITAPQ